MKRRSGQSRYQGWMSCIFWESERTSEFKAFPALLRLSPGPGRYPPLSMPGKNEQIRPQTQGARAAECPHGHCLLAHPSKTKLSFSERNIRGHSICLHSWPTNKGLILAIISLTPTPTPIGNTGTHRPRLSSAARSLKKHTGSPTGESPGRTE